MNLKELKKLAATFSGMGRLISKMPSSGLRPLRSIKASPEVMSQQDKILGMLKGKSGNMSSAMRQLRELTGH